MYFEAKKTKKSIYRRSRPEMREWVKKDPIFALSGCDYVGLILKIPRICLFRQKTDNFRFSPEMRGWVKKES